MQVKARRDDGFIFRLHRIGQCGEIGIAGFVVVVLQKERDHAGGRRIHESAFNIMGLHRGFKVRDILFQLALAF